MSMTLAGFVTGPENQVDDVFAWLQKGQHTVTRHGGKDDFCVDEACAEELRAGFELVGALIAGRRLFDLAHGWAGRHPTSSRTPAHRRLGTEVDRHSSTAHGTTQSPGPPAETAGRPTPSLAETPCR